MAKLIGLTPAALYTRQRVLMDMGLMESVEGRGPGSGAPLNAHNVAALLISLLAADSLQDTDQRVRAIGKSVPDGDEAKCPFTGMTNFQSAVAAVLDSPDDLAQSCTGISVSRPSMALIGYGRPRAALFSQFHARTATPKNASRIQIVARIDVSIIRLIAARLHAEM